MTQKMQKIDADSPEAKSADLVAENIARLKALFPELVTEGEQGASVNVDVLKQLVGDQTVTDADEKYGLNWFGKRKARQLALTPSLGTLRPAPEESVDWETTQNLMIEGDNLEVLKLLQKSYAGKVKLIYIDPPYNTGKDFVYPDDFRDGIRNYLELTEQIDGGKSLSSNSESSGRFHSTWMNMIYPRLKVAKDLLRSDGAAFISIDDNEFDNLVLICNEIFGEENKVGVIARKTKLTSNKGSHFAPSHEYVIVYARQIENLNDFNDPEAQEDEDYLSLFRFEDDRGKYNEVSLYMPSLDARANQRYFIKCPDGSLVIPPGKTFPVAAEDLATITPYASDKVWRWTPETFQKNKLENRVVFKETKTSPLVDQTGKQSKWNIYTKIYLHERQEAGLRPATFFDKYPNSAASKMLIKLGIPFSFSKPFELVSWFLKITSTTNTDIVLDFFSGSGTTGHSVMAQNAIDEGRRRYILVQVPEPLDPENKEQHAASNLCDSIGKPRTIAELTKERLRRAGKKIRDENPMFTGDTGFRVFKLDSSNLRAWDPDRDNLEQTLLDHAEHVKPDRTENDLLYELLLKLGLDLCVPIAQRTLGGSTVHSVGGGVLMACLAADIGRNDVEALAQGIVTWHKEQAPVGETTCVFRDSAFPDEASKANMTAILEQAGITHVRSL